MKPMILLDSTPTPSGSGVMTLHRRDTEFIIRVDGFELMNSRQHGSEDALATLAAEVIAAVAAPRVLIGGLGMGFTLAAANASLPPSASIDVAELVGAVVEWNRGELGECAGRPLDDARVQVFETDVRVIIERSDEVYDAILLDVDNGPAALSDPANGWLYSLNGLRRIRAALRRGGVLSVWSAGPDERFTRMLRSADFDAETHVVRARKNGKGARHTIWVATALPPTLRPESESKP